MADIVSCPVCGARHDASDLFCPKCGVAGSRAHTIRRGDATAATPAVPVGAPTPPAAPVTNVLLQELQETLAPQIQVVKELGAGGMGTVFLGRDPALKRLVAIKVLNPDLASDESARLRFAREAEAAAAVAHPNVVSIFQVGALPRSKASYFVMQFIDGRTLSEEFPQGKPVPMPQARRIIGEVATALAAAHAKGLVHRDIKPANIMIDSETGRTVVLDFGISAVLQQRKQPTESKLTAAGFSSGTPTEPKLTAAGTSIGTPTYMSPEQASADEVTDKSDVYSLGVVAFELLTGRPPFVAASSWALMAAHINETPPKVRDLAPNVDPELADLIDTCLTKDPTARPAAASIARYLLPGAQSILEWPPPGLEQLHGTGSRLVTALGITVGVFWLFFASVLLQPARSLACCWSQALGWSLWDNLAGAVSAIMPVMLEDKDVLPFWRVVVFGCVVSAPLFGVFVWRRAWQFADGVRRARRAGYPWRVALQVAWDRRADTVSLLNGVDAYALLPEATRRRLVRLRWWQETCLGAAVLAATVMPLAWITGIIAHGGPASGEALPGAETLLIAAPALGCLLAAAALARPEARVRRRARAQRRPVRRGTVTIRPELVDVWLRAADVPAARGRRALPRPLVAAAAVIVVVVLAIAAALAVGATLLAASYVDLQRDMLTYWNPASARSDWRELRDLLSAYGGGRAAGRGVVHDVAPLVPVAFLGARERRRPIWAVDTMLLRAYPPESVGGDEPTLVRSDLARAWRLLPGRLPDSLAAALARDTASPGLRLWEAFASSPPPPPLWYLRPGLGGVQDLDDISFWAFSAIDPRLAAPRNTAAAVLALAAGDKAGALARAHENLAVGWRFYRDVGQFAVVFGLEVLDWGIGDLEAIGRVTADRSVIAEAARLRAAHARVKPRVATVDGVQQWIWPGFVQGGSMLFADPANPVGFGDISDTSLAPSLRFNLLSQVLWGYCTSAREILFGIDTHRRELLAEAERRLMDIPRSSDWVDLNRRYLDWVIADPWSAWRAKHISSPAGVLAVAGAIGLRGAAGRMSLCIWH